ncbi:SDR family NAD(P)-dependent oxidoreductase [Patulibacter brassicae]|uniref:SDR family NAD(P)-dependent oxidoreductase n=1 Tax=Patulibacter brassicae TaxID=1705717 RepID=A0ABU4VH24_9ACTN|nr:SDR family NAD(P)-dependent oxidoreductase [Patulibacter brassicae]MDX8150720.1 SDR family NAD(P)-dependent oxidoreductase [Patulibacter brassicae]
MSGELEGRVALVTGAGQGIGAACADALAAEGATVVRTDLTGGDITLDVRDEGAIAKAVDQVVEQHGKLDIAVANAGVAFVKPLAQVTFDEWRNLMSINLDGVFLTAREAARVMVPQGSGSIINMASISGLKGSPLIGTYAAAKAGVVSISRTLGLELRDFGIRVNAVCPGFADTEMVRSHMDELTEAIGMPAEEVIGAKQGRLGTAEEIAKLVTFLASDRSRFSTSEAFVLDGGATGALV